MMTPKQKIIEILQRLLERSQAGEVNWIADDFEPQRIYYLHFPSSCLVLTYRSPRTEPDGIEVAIKKNDPSEEEVTVTSLYVEEGDEDWELVHDLYREAERRVTKWDQVLSGIESAMRTPGTVGLPSNSFRN